MNASMRCVAGALVGFFVGHSPPSWGMSPHVIHYQGRLIDGTNLVNGVAGIVFRMFEEAAGGSPIFTESNQVMVVDGLYSAHFGESEDEGTVMEAVRYDSLYLEIEINGVVLSPREPVGSVPRALIAAQVPEGSIDETMLADGSVTSAKIANQAVTQTQLMNRAVTTAAIAPYTVASDQLQLVSGYTGGFIPLTNASSPTASAGERFGWSLMLGQNPFAPRLFVGAPFANVGASGAGAVWRFPPSDTSFDFAAGVLFTNPTPAVGEQFGFSMANMESLASPNFVIGIPGAEAGLTKTSGAVAVYGFSGFVGEVVNPFPEAGARFGHAVATGPGPGGSFLVGAPFSSAFQPGGGAAYLYNPAGSLISSFSTSLSQAGDRFGWALLAIETNRVLIGAPGANVGATDAGRIYEFNRDGVIMRVISCPDPRAGGGFGSSLAKIGNSVIAVGEPGGSVTGRVHLYGMDLTYLKTIAALPTGTDSNAFGFALAAVGPGMLAVGSPTADFISVDQGRATLFDTQGNDLGLVVPSVITGSAQAGYALLATDNRTLILGAPFQQVGAQAEAGHIAMVRLDTFMEGLFAEGVRDRAIGVAQLDTESVDKRYVKKTGDTMTGGLLIESSPPAGIELAVGQSTSRVWMTSGGRVGIGTTPSPLSELHVQGGVHVAGTARDFSVPPSEVMQFGQWDGTNFTERMRINTSGLVGIGTVGPNSLLHVRAPAGVDPLRVQADGVTRLRMSAEGGVGIGGNISSIAAPLHVAGSVHISGTTRGFTVPPTEALPFGHWDGSTFTERVRIHTNGRVGIGTNTPQARLHVGGTPGTDGIMFPDGSVQTRAASMIRTSVVVSVPSVGAGQLRRQIIPVPGAQLGMGVVVNRDDLTGLNYVNNFLIIANAYVAVPGKIDVILQNRTSVSEPARTQTYHITLFP